MNLEKQHAKLLKLQAKADGSYRAPKQIADAMGHTLDTHLLSYSRFQTKDLASAFDETSSDRMGQRRWTIDLKRMA